MERIAFYVKSDCWEEREEAIRAVKAGLYMLCDAVSQRGCYLYGALVNELNPRELNKLASRNRSRRVDVDWFRHSEHR